MSGIQTTAKDLRVLIFTPCYHVLDGVTITLRKVVQAVEERGGQVMIATADVSKEILESENFQRTNSLHDDFTRTQMLYVPSVPLPYDSTDSYSICRMIHHNNEIKQKILEFKPNVLHITAPDPFCYSVCLWARENSLPLMGTWHSNIPDYMDHVGPLQRIFLKPILVYVFRNTYTFPRITYVPQKTLLDKMRRQHYERRHADGSVSSELRIWGRGVNVSLFSTEKRSLEFRRKLGVADDVIVVLWVGRCVKEKRPDVWVYVLNKLEQKYPGKVVGFLVGRGDRYDLMNKPKNVIGLGWKGREELATVYASSDVLLFPSGVETFGNVTLEGMASGLPCVVDRSCSSHLIEDGVIGYTCDQSDNLNVMFERYYKAVERIVCDNELRSKMSRKAREVAVTKWSNERIFSQIVENYVEIANMPKEEFKPIDFTFNFEYWLVYCLYMFIQFGGVMLVQVIGSFAFYWQSAHKTVINLTVALGIFFGATVALYNYGTLH